MSVKFESILVPVDGSDPSFRALDVAASFASASGARLDVVTVLDLRHVDFYEGFYLTPDQLESLEKQASDSILERAQTRAKESGVDASVELLKGATLKLLLEKAEDYSMVFMGRTGKSAWERLVEGSISRGMSTHSPVPITIVP